MRSDDPATFCTTDHGCITCSDEGVEVRVVATGAGGLADCRDPQGVTGVVDTTLVGEVVPGEALLVHAGVALVRLRREEAAP